MDKILNWSPISKIVSRKQKTTKEKPKLSKAEQQKKKQDEACKALVREVSFYVIFLILLIATAVNNRDERAYLFKENTVNILNAKSVVDKVTIPDDMWKWANSTLIPFLFAENQWLGDSIDDVERSVSTLTSYRVGPIRVRQHRLKEESCGLHPIFEDVNWRCEPAWSSSSRDWFDYDPGWQYRPQIVDLDSTERKRSPWEYHKWSDIGGLPIPGEIGIYPPGGYVFSLNEGLNESRKQIEDLKSQNWVDKQTRVVIWEFTIYCSNANMFAMVTALFEFEQANVILGKVSLHTFRLFSYLGSYPSAQLACDFLVYVAIIWFAAIEMHKIYTERCSYFKQFWNLLELLNLLTSLTSIVLYIGRHVVTDTVSKEVNRVDGQFYNFQTLAMWDLLFGYLIGFVCFLSTLQVLHLLRFNRRMSVLGATLRSASEDLIAFAVFFMLVFMGFVSFCYMMFGRDLSPYRSVVASMETLFVVSLGDFDYHALYAVNFIFGPVFLFFYMMFIVFILINMLITILNDAFAVVRDDVSKQPNDHELVDYIIDRLSNFLWKFNPFQVFWAGAKKLGLVKSDKPGDSKSPLHSGHAHGSRRHRQHSRRRQRQGRHANLRFIVDIAIIHKKLDFLMHRLDSMHENRYMLGTARKHNKKSLLSQNVAAASTKKVRINEEPSYNEEPTFEENPHFVRKMVNEIEARNLSEINAQKETNQSKTKNTDFDKHTDFEPSIHTEKAQIHHPNGYDEDTSLYFTRRNLSCVEEEDDDHVVPDFRNSVVSLSDGSDMEFHDFQDINATPKRTIISTDLDEDETPVLKSKKIFADGNKKISEKNVPRILPVMTQPLKFVFPSPVRGEMNLQKIGGHDGRNDGGYAVSDV